MTDSKKNDERANNLKKAYTKATADLRNAYPDEFQALYAGHAADLGVEYKPRPSAAQKAQADLAALLEKNPELEETLMERARSILQEEQAAGAPGYATAPDYSEPTPPATPTA